MTDVPPRDDLAREPRPATLWQTVSAVLWGFLGVRRGDAMRRDLSTIRPLQVVIVGLVLAAGLVITLLVIVRLVTRSA